MGLSNGIQRRLLNWQNMVLRELKELDKTAKFKTLEERIGDSYLDSYRLVKANWLGRTDKIAIMLGPKIVNGDGSWATIYREEVLSSDLVVIAYGQANNPGPNTRDSGNRDKNHFRRILETAKVTQHTYKLWKFREPNHSMKSENFYLFSKGKPMLWRDWGEEGDSR